MIRRESSRAALAAAAACLFGAAVADAQSRLIHCRNDETVYEGRLERADQVELYHFDATHGEAYRFHTEAVFVDTKLTLYDLDGTTVLLENDSFGSPPGRFFDAALLFQPARSGRYTIAVTPGETGLLGAYLLFTLRSNTLLLGRPTADRLEGASPVDRIYQPQLGLNQADTGDQFAAAMLAGQVLYATVVFAATVPPPAVELRLSNTPHRGQWLDPVTLALVVRAEAEGSFVLQLNNPGRAVSDYTITLDYDSSALEPDSFASPAAGGFLSLVQGLAVDTPDDADYVRFSGLVNSNVKITAMAEQIGSPLDAALAVYDVTGTLLRAVGNSIGRDPSLAVRGPADGRIIVCVSGEHGTTGPYRLTLTAGTDLYEANDRPDAPAVVGYGRFAANLGPHPDPDYYAFDTRAGDRIAVDIDADRADGIPFSSQIDARLTLWGPDGALLARNERRTPRTRDPRLEFVAPQTGRYVVLVDEAVPRFTTPAAFPYELTIRLDGDVNFDGVADWRDLFLLGRQWQRRGPHELTGDYLCNPLDLPRHLHWRLQR